MRDDVPPLEIILELDKFEHKPLPTCNKDNEEILQYKILPLTRARDFLKIVTSFAGLIEPFRNLDLSLYYTLTRKRAFKKSVKLGERTLYITVFDHKERTTRVYTQDNDMDTFYSMKSDAPLVDVEHFLLEVEIDAKIDAKGDPVSNDSNILNSLRKHYQSILERIQYRLGADDITKSYSIENSWTMKVEDTSTLQRLREEDVDNWRMVVENGKEEERKEESLAICDYFMHTPIEREQRLLDEKRADWIARRMEMISKETKERFQGELEAEYRVDKQVVDKKPATKSPEEIELMLYSEQYFMELLLLCEVAEWEELFWNKLKSFLDQFGNDQVEVKERLTKEWRANCWKRLNPQMHAAVKRLAKFDKDKDWFPKRLGKWWASSISQFFEGVEKPNSISLSKLKEEIKPLGDDSDEMIEMRLRMEKEIEDTEFRLKHGSVLGRFDQSWDDNSLFECRYSRSKWLYFCRDLSSAPLEIYSHALEGNENVIHITFSEFGTDPDLNRFQNTIRDLPWVTSVSFGDQLAIAPAIHRDLLKLDISSTYIFMDAGPSDMFSLPERLGNNARALISFVAPTSGRSLILRLKHSGEEDGPLELTLGSTTIQLNPSSKSSLTIDDLTLYQIPGPSESDHLLFEPGIRNDIVIEFRGTVEKHGHFLHDMELLNEDRLEYMPH